MPAAHQNPHLVVAAPDYDRGVAVDAPHLLLHLHLHVGNEFVVPAATHTHTSSSSSSSMVPILSTVVMQMIAFKHHPGSPQLSLMLNYCNGLEG
jgi:hypothetical protein